MDTLLVFLKWREGGKNIVLCRLCVISHSQIILCSLENVLERWRALIAIHATHACRHCSCRYSS